MNRCIVEIFLISIFVIFFVQKSESTTTILPVIDDSDSGLNFADQKYDNSIEIYADRGFELSQISKTIIGRVNVKAIRGGVTIKSNKLTAHYREKSFIFNKHNVDKKNNEIDDVNEIWRVEADGCVSIVSSSQYAYGDHADYNIDDAMLILTGNNLRFLTKSDIITAKDSLEYWEHNKRAVARGNATVFHADKHLQADILIADFTKNINDKQLTIKQIHGYNKVIMTTPQEIVIGDRADYDFETDIVTVTGSVKMTKEENQINGEYAEINLKTGITIISPNIVNDEKQQRVNALITPKKLN